MFLAHNLYFIIIILYFYIFIPNFLYKLASTVNPRLMIFPFSDSSKSWQCWKSNFRTNPLTYDCHRIPAVTWWRFKCITAEWHLQLSQHPVVTQSSFEYFTVGFRQVSGEAGSKISSHNHVTYHLITVDDLHNNHSGSEIVNCCHVMSGLMTRSLNITVASPSCGHVRTTCMRISLYFILAQLNEESWVERQWPAQSYLVTFCNWV